MNINKAATTLVVLWALVVLKQRKKCHSVKKILILINGKTLSNRTVINALDYLEKNQVIVCPYPKGKERQGKRYQFSLYPFKVPEEVLEARLKGNTLRRAIDEVVGEGLSAWKNNVYRVNGRYLTEEMTAPLVKIAASMKTIAKELFDIESDVEFTHEWIIRSIHDQPLRLEEDFLILFQIFICSQFAFAYPEEALSQIQDLMNQEGA